MDPQQIVLSVERQEDQELKPEITQLDLRTIGIPQPDTCIKRPNEITIASCGIGIDTAGALLIPPVIKADVFIFADTGSEPIFVYNYLEYLRSLGIPIITVKSHLGRLYDYYKERKIVPTITSRQCTDKFKIRVIRKYIRKRFGKKVKFNMMKKSICLSLWQEKFKPMTKMKITKRSPDSGARVLNYGQRAYGG